MEGATFKRVEQRRPDLRFPFPDRFTPRLRGKRLTHMRRRAKYLCGHLSSGEVLIMHLGMSGRFTISGAGATARQLAEFTYDTGSDPTHDHVVFHMSNGSVVTYNDPRRFGFMDLVAADNLDTCRHFSGMGVEPLGNALHAGYLARPRRRALYRPQGVSARPAQYRGPRQYLRLRGALPCRHQSAPQSVISHALGRPTGRTHRTARANNQGRAERGDRGWRLDFARLCGDRRRPRLLPTCVPGIRS